MVTSFNGYGFMKAIVVTIYVHTNGTHSASLGHICITKLSLLCTYVYIQNIHHIFYSKIIYLRILQCLPVHPETQLQDSGIIQVPPL